MWTNTGRVGLVHIQCGSTLVGLGLPTSGVGRGKLTYSKNRLDMYGVEIV